MRWLRHLRHKLAPGRLRLCVWELTLRCNLACSLCGSRAGRAGESELSTAEALSVVKQLAENGFTEVTLVGGEAFLREDFLDIARAITGEGMTCSVVSGGLDISAGLARATRDAGVTLVSISLDGLEATHDRLRRRAGSFQSALLSLGHLRAVGMPVACNTQINRLSLPELPQLYEQLRESGVSAWQLQLTVPAGRAVGHPELFLQPYEIPELFERLVPLAKRGRREGLRIRPGNNIGYFGPYHRVINGVDSLVFQGCLAGHFTLGLEADGAVKACASLPSDPYVGGNLRLHPLREILKRPKIRVDRRPIEELWGFCRTCPHAVVCRGGCTWMAHAMLGRPGNNPHCHFRALELARLGLRERFEPLEGVSREPSGQAHFRLIQEPAEDVPGVIWPVKKSPR